MDSHPWPLYFAKSRWSELAVAETGTIKIEKHGGTLRIVLDDTWHELPGVTEVRWSNVGVDMPVFRRVTFNDAAAEGAAMCTVALEKPELVRVMASPTLCIVEIGVDAKKYAVHGGN